MTRTLLPASRRTRLRSAAVVWTAVGTGLLAAGAIWLYSARPAFAALGGAAAVGVGWLKGRLVLAPRAVANARRILSSPDRTSLLGLFPPSSWALVAVMMASGTLLRRSGLPRPWLGVVYAAVGVALLRASADAWRASGRAWDPSSWPGSPGDGR